MRLSLKWKRSSKARREIHSVNQVRILRFIVIARQIYDLPKQSTKNNWIATILLTQNLAMTNQGRFTRIWLESSARFALDSQ